MTDITELAHSLKAAAEKASSGDWVKESGDGWDATCSNDDQANSGFIIAHFVGPDSAANREFVHLANPANVLALVEALEKAQQRITQMESRTVTDWIEHDGKWRPESLGLDELVYLKTRKQELKIPYPAGKVKGWMNTGGDMDVMAYKLASPQARTVTVKLNDINEYLAEVQDKTLNRALRLLAEGVRAGDVAAMRAAGIKVEVE